MARCRPGSSSASAAWLGTPGVLRARWRYHRCELCTEPTWGDGNVFVPAGERAFVAPNLLPHYIEAHGYAPPPEFIAAVMACPLAGSTAYTKALTRLCRPSAPAPLEGVAAVRARPGMYFGGQDARGLEQMLFELLANALDQHLAGRVTSVDVALKDGWVTIEDDGAGIPVDATTGPSVLETAFTQLHDTPTFDGHHPHVHVRSIGAGVAAVAVLCARMEVDTVRGGVGWRAEFERGRLIGPLVETGPTERRGTRLRYLADERIFGPAQLELSGLEPRFRELGFLFPRLSLRLQGVDHQRRDGGEARVWALAPDVVKESVVSATGTIDEIDVEVTFGWSPSRSAIETYVNYAPTQEGGLHREGFLRALERTAPTPGALANLRGGLVGVVHARLLAPRFGGPTASRLLNEEAATAVDGVVSQAMRSVAPWWWDRVLELARRPA